jgi:hypothetical protein
MIRRKTKRVFSPQTSRPSSRDENQTQANVDGEDGSEPTVLGPSQQDPASSPKKQKKDGAIALSQLLFIVGHVAIKQIVHLELCELDFKRRKQEKEKTAAAAKADKSTASVSSSRRKSTTKDKAKEPQEEEGDELDLIGGTTEDDFTEAMAHIRERELLFGPQSLLALFGPLVSEICANNTSYKDRGLQQAATLCLAKLMCVSSEYCEANLPLLITIMERSADATVRSNAVIALGDMAVCFNHLIDENTDFLYRRLADPDPSVKRTCLMTLTFLILAGQVKVKGQLGEMAKCLEDEDKRIADLARMFFTELSTKDNAVYNHFVDMFSLLSADRGMEEESFRRVVKFLLGFVEKVSLDPRHGPRMSPCQSVLILTARFRTSMPNNWLTSWLPVSGAVTLSGSGTMLRLPWASYSTRTKTSPSWSQRASSWCRVRLLKLSLPYVAIQLEWISLSGWCWEFGLGGEWIPGGLLLDTCALMMVLMVLMFLLADNTIFCFTVFHISDFITREDVRGI